MTTKWLRLNKEINANYSRDYISKKIKVDPEYRKLVCDKICKFIDIEGKIKIRNLSDEVILKVVNEMNEPMLFNDPSGIDQGMYII
jgi:hypothetical protein